VIDDWRGTWHEPADRIDANLSKAGAAWPDQRSLLLGASWRTGSRWRVAGGVKWLGEEILGTARGRRGRRMARLRRNAAGEPRCIHDSGVGCADGRSAGSSGSKGGAVTFGKIEVRSTVSAYSIDSVFDGFHGCVSSGQGGCSGPWSRGGLQGAQTTPRRSSCV